MRIGSVRLNFSVPLLVVAIALLPASQAQEVPGARWQKKEPASEHKAIERIEQADQLLRQGNEQYQTGQLEAAVKLWQQALVIYRQNQNQQGEGTALTSLGATLVMLERYQEAVTYLEAYLPIARSSSDRRAESQALGNLGIAYKALGRYGEAISVHKQAGRLMLALGDRPGLGQVLLNLGNTFESVGDYNSAIAAYQQSLKIAQQSNDRTAEGIALGNLGQVYANQGEYEKAITTHEQSLNIAQAVQNRASEASTFINLGSTYHSLGKRERALVYYQQALKAAQVAGDRRREGEALGSLGLVYDDLGQYIQAIEYLQKCLAIARAIGNPEAEGFALNNLGHAFLGAGKLTEAEAQLRAAIKLFDSLRLGLSDTYKVSIFDKQVHSYSLLQQILVAANKAEAALEAAEQGRARAFAEMLARRTKRAGNTPPTVTRGTERKETTQTQFQNPQDRSLGIQPIEIQQIKQIARQQNATLVEYAIVPDDDFKFRGKQRGRESELFVWVVQPNGKVHFRRVDLKSLWQQKATLTDVVQVARCLVPGSDCGPVAQAIRGIGVVASSEKPQPAPTNPAQNRSVPKQPGLRKLHDLLITPIADLLPTDPNSRVVFIPQESLFLIPFAALQNPDGKYLIENHTVLTAPSIQVLELTRQQRLRQRVGSEELEPRNRRQATSSTFLFAAAAFAVPFASSAAPTALIVGNPTMPKVTLIPGEPPEPLAPLPGAEQEALKIAELLNTKALIGNEATKAAVKQQLPNARIIHFATHGLLEYGSQSNYVSLEGLGVPGAIALAPSETDQGLLTADEILNLQLEANLVVLSACDTGQGRITGDGVIGLSRAFITAGVPSVVVSLWAVPDAPTAQLMMAFYQHLQQNPDKAIALRQAMIDTMQDYPRPLDWAAFTLIGEAE